VAIANELQLEAARATPALSTLITTPCQVRCRRTIRCRIMAFFLLIRNFTMWPWPVTPWTWPLTCVIEHLQRIASDVMKLWTQSNNPRRSYCDFSVWPYDLEYVLVLRY